MGDVIPFKPGHNLGAKKNVQDFIDFCKKLTLYGEDLDWEAVRWPVGDRHRPRGTYTDTMEMIFSTLESTKWNTIPLHSDFMDFGKSYMRYNLTFSGEKNFSSQLSAVRVLEKALIDCSRDGVPRAWLTDEIVTDRAVQIIREKYTTPGSQYLIGWRIERICTFLVEKRLIEKTFEWKNPFKQPEAGTLVGEEFEIRRAAKLPTREVLAAVGTIFDKATEERDVVASSAFAILCSAPDRICETVTIQNHSEVWLQNPDGSKDLGLRWNPAKEGAKGIKPINKEMEQVVVMAIERVRAITEEARRIARWYEENPDKLYLPEELEHLRSKDMITGNEFAQIIGARNGTTSPKLAKEHGLTIHKVTVVRPSKPYKDGTLSQSKLQINHYSFAEVEQKIISYLPPGFPWMDRENGLKYSEALFVVKKGLFNPTQATMPCMFVPISTSVIIYQFAGQTKANSIFDRFGLKNPDGSPMRMSTHQARHWLNTLAERGGLSDLERDMWSGRRTNTVRDGESRPTSRQSLAYLHNTVEELLESAGLQADDMDLGGSFSAVIDKLPITPEEFLELQDKPTVHVTEFGICAHDFSMQPCQVHADCLNCVEHACIKGDAKKAERIQQLLAIVVEQIKLAMQLVEEKYLKAEPWYQHQILTLKRLTSLLEILNDDSVSPDSLVFLVNPFQYSALRNAVTRRATNLADSQSVAFAEMLNVPPLPLIEELQSKLCGAGL